MTSDTSLSTSATLKPSEANLQEWLEGFAERLKGRTNAVSDEVQQVVDEMGAVELSLQNTFNSFRCLSSSQFVENVITRVYDEDETEVISAAISKQDAKQPSMPTESYEEEILPRYKDAVALAWAAFQGGNGQRDQSSIRARSRSNLRYSDQDEKIQILPHIIGTEAFTRDIHCGLADLRQRQHGAKVSEYDAVIERDGADLAAELIGTQTPSEVDMSGTDSDASDNQDGGLEPAVSAALDFKAMLEAALRNPSLPYDGGTSNDSDNAFGEFGDNKFSLPDLANDTFSNSPRAISTMVDIIGRTMSTMIESKDDFHGNTSEVSNANVNKSLPPDSHQQPEVSFQSTPKEDATPFRSLQPDEGDPRHPLRIEELSKQPFNSPTQAMLNEEIKQFFDNTGDRMQVGTSDLGHVPPIPGGLFDDEESDTRFPPKDYSALPNSNTGPTVPEKLFQKQPSLRVTQHTRSESQSSNSFDSSQAVLHSEPSVVNTITGTSSRDSSFVFRDPERKDSDKSQPPVSSPVPKHASPHSASSSISSGSNVITGSQLADPLPIRGGLFDDDEDEDEDPGDLFRASVPAVESQPILRPWASRSSKGLFDDVKDIETEQNVATDEAGSSHKVQHISNISPSLTSQYKNQVRHGALDSRRQDVDSDGASPGTTHPDLVMSTDPKEIESNSQNGGGGENRQVPIPSMLAAAIRSSVMSGGDSDEDSWSGPESEENSVTGEKGDMEQYIVQDSALESPETNFSEIKETEGRMAEDLIQLKTAVSVESDHLVQRAASAEKPSPVPMYAEEGGNSDLMSHTAHEVPPVRSPPYVSRAFSATETLPPKIAMAPAESPLLQSKGLEVSDTDESDHDSDGSPNQSQRVGQPQAVQTTSSHTVDPSSEHLAPSTSQPTSSVKETLSAQTSTEASNPISEDVSKKLSRDVTVPVHDFGQLSSRRNFTPLFEDDDAEEDLFGQGSVKHQGGLFPGTGQLETGLSSDTPFAIGLGGQVRAVNSAPSLIMKDMTPQLPHAPSNPLAGHSMTSHPKHAENEGSLPSAKSASKLSSLLFGDDDQDNEDALFGPLGGRATRGSNSLKSGRGASIFGDADLPSTSARPAVRGHSLFDD